MARRRTIDVLGPTPTRVTLVLDDEGYVHAHTANANLGAWAITRFGVTFDADWPRAWAAANGLKEVGSAPATT